MAPVVTTTSIILSSNNIGWRHNASLPKLSMKMAAKRVLLLMTEVVHMFMTYRLTGRSKKTYVCGV